MDNGLSPILAHLEKTQMVWLVSGLWFCALYNSPEKVSQHLLISFCFHYCSHR